MDIEQLDLVAVCGLLGLLLDPNDKRQFKGAGFRLAVNGCKWFDHEARRGGGGAVDLVMHIKQFGFMQAVYFLGGILASVPIIQHVTPSKTPAKKATRPPQADLNHLATVKNYLTAKRFLNAEFVQWCIDRGLIYADSHANCVFKYGVNGAELRGTGAVQWRACYGVMDSGFFYLLKMRNISRC